MKTLNRRTLLRGAIAGGSVAIGLPLLEAMMPRKASAQGAVPKRIVFWFSANGTRQDIWSPAADLSGLDTHPLHAALAPFASKLIFLDGVDDQMANNSIGDGHQTGMACLLTNQAINPGNLFCEGDCPAGSEVYVGWGGGISLDQHIANEIEKNTLLKFKSLELGVQVKNATVWSRMCYTAGDQPVPPRENPDQNFTDLFSDLQADPFALEIIRKQRKSVLDAVIQDYMSFNPRLGADDRMRLDQHLDGIREVEKRLDATGGFGEACEQPTIVSPGDQYQQEDNFGKTGQAQMDLLVMALACDMTRVASLQWSGAVSNVNFGSMGVNLILNEGHHSLSHYDDSDGSSQADLLSINKWYTDQFAYLLNKMNSIDEGNGTMLDNSVVVWVNELGKGNSHTRNDIPFILAGGCQGYLQTGRGIDYGGEPHGKLLVSLANAMDVPVNTFGDPQFSQGPLSGLSA